MNRSSFKWDQSAPLRQAVRDGKPARGIGGTADIVSYARQNGIPVAVLWPEGAHTSRPTRIPATGHG